MAKSASTGSAAAAVRCMFVNVYRSNVHTADAEEASPGRRRARRARRGRATRARGEQEGVLNAQQCACVRVGSANARVCLQSKKVAAPTGAPISAPAKLATTARGKQVRVLSRDLRAIKVNTSHAAGSDDAD